MQPKAKPKRRWWRWAVLILLGLYVVFLGRPTYLVVRAWLGDHPVHEQLPEGQADDASRMQRTAVAEVARGLVLHLDGATVRIANIYHRPLSFIRELIVELWHEFHLGP